MFRSYLDLMPKIILVLIYLGMSAETGLLLEGGPPRLGVRGTFCKVGTLYQLFQGFSESTMQKSPQGYPV